MNVESMDALAVESMKQKIEEQFDDSEAQELRGIFEDVDTSKSGKIDFAEFAKGLESLGLGLDSATVEAEFVEILKHKQKIKRAYDPAADLDAQIEFEDFEEFWQSNVCPALRVLNFEVLIYIVHMWIGKQDEGRESRNDAGGHIAPKFKKDAQD